MRVCVDGFNVCPPFVYFFVRFLYVFFVLNISVFLICLSSSSSLIYSRLHMTSSVPLFIQLSLYYSFVDIILSIILPHHSVFLPLSYFPLSPIFDIFIIFILSQYYPLFSHSLIFPLLSAFSPSSLYTHTPSPLPLPFAPLLLSFSFLSLSPPFSLIAFRLSSPFFVNPFFPLSNSLLHFSVVILSLPLPIHSFIVCFPAMHSLRCSCSSLLFAFIYLFIYSHLLFSYLSFNHLFIDLFFLSIYLLIYCSRCLFICLSIHVFIRLSFIYLFIHGTYLFFTYFFIHIPIYLFNYSFIYLFICSAI